MEEALVPYSEPELKAVVEGSTGNTSRFQLDFDRVWGELGFTLRKNAVRALLRSAEGMRATRSAPTGAEPFIDC
jgi:hypothetical protein